MIDAYPQATPSAYVRMSACSVLGWRATATAGDLDGPAA